MAYSSENKVKIFTEVCNYIQEGMSVKKASKMANFTHKTFFEWIDKEAKEDKGTFLRDLYARACNYRAEQLFEEILEISDDGSNDTYEDEEGNKRVDHDHIQRSRLRVDSRKWMLAKMMPKKYGDKTDLNISGNLNITEVVFE